MREIGKMIFNMDMELRLGLMDLGMRVIIKMEKSMDKGLIPGAMGQSM